MERSYTYAKPTNLFDESSDMETVSCNYVGPEEILVVVGENGKWSVAEIPLQVDGVWSEIDTSDLAEDMSIDGETDRYVLLDANTDNHVPLMQLIAGEEVKLKDEIALETIGTYTHSDGSTFELKFEDPFDSIDPTSVIDDDATIIASDNTVDYAYNFASVTNDQITEGLDSGIAVSAEKKLAAESAATKKLWAKQIAILEWIKSDIIGTVDPVKVVIPSIVDVELGATFAERDI